MAQGEQGDNANLAELNLQRVGSGVSALRWIRRHGPTEGFSRAM